MRFLILLFPLLILTTAAKAQNLRFFAEYPNIDLTTWYISNGWANGPHQICEWQSNTVSGLAHKLQLKIIASSRGDRPYACGEIQSKKKMSFGRYEARMRASSGSGVNSAFFTFTGPPHGVKEHDEIDFEFLGKDPRLVQLGYWANGKNYAVKVHELPYDASKEFHNYAFEWNTDSIKWYIDGSLVHESLSGDPIPRNPGKIFFSLWAGGEMMNDWLGEFEYSGPLTAEIEWVRYSAQ